MIGKSVWAGDRTGPDVNIDGALMRQVIDSIVGVRLLQDKTPLRVLRLAELVWWLLHRKMVNILHRLRGGREEPRAHLRCIPRPQLLVWPLIGLHSVSDRLLLLNQRSQFLVNRLILPQHLLSLAAFLFTVILLLWITSAIFLDSQHFRRVLSLVDLLFSTVQSFHSSVTAILLLWGGPQDCWARLELLLLVTVASPASLGSA